MRIKDKKLFKEQMKVIIISVVLIIVTILVATYLRNNGFESLFTTNLYKEAFERNPNDIILINRLEAIFIIGIFALGIQELKYNKKESLIEKEGEELCKWLLSH